MFKCLTVLIIVLSFHNAFAQEKFLLKKDLREQWLVYANGNLNPAGSELAESVYFKIDAGRFPNHRLLIKSSRSFYVFINGKLIEHAEAAVALPLDSLSNIYLSQLTFSVYQEGGVSADLETLLIGEGEAEQQVAAKPVTYFKDFVIVAGLIVIIFFVAMMRAHPKLASDYFSVGRILSLREAEDNQLSSRFALSANILFYVFSSLLLALCLIILFFNLPEGYTLPFSFRAYSFGGIMLQWIRLSVIILTLFFCKILLIYALSNLFGLRGIAGVHFFNWVRLLLMVAGVLSVILFIYYVSRGYNSTVYVAFLTFFAVALAGWNVIAFLKLNNKNEHTMFHLFSYICATEIIPLLITIKVLFQ